MRHEPRKQTANRALDIFTTTSKKRRTKKEKIISEIALETGRGVRYALKTSHHNRKRFPVNRFLQLSHVGPAPPPSSPLPSPPGGPQQPQLVPAHRGPVKSPEKAPKACASVRSANTHRWQSR